MYSIFLNIQVLKTIIRTFGIKNYICFKVNMLKYIFLVVVSVITPFIAQNKDVFEKNIVPNGSFENYRKKSESIRQAIPWTQIASVDFYQKPVEKDTGYRKRRI